MEGRGDTRELVHMTVREALEFIREHGSTQARHTAKEICDVLDASPALAVVSEMKGKWLVERATFQAVVIAHTLRGATEFVSNVLAGCDIFEDAVALQKHVAQLKVSAEHLRNTI